MEGGFGGVAQWEGGFGGAAQWELVEGGCAVGGEGGSGAACHGGSSGAVARHGGSVPGGAVWSGGDGGSLGGWSGPAAEVLVPKKRKKSRKTRRERGLDSWKLGLRPPAFEEFFDEDASEKEPDDEVGDDKESRDRKSRHVLNQLKLGKWDYQPEFGKYICPFCKNVRSTDYDWMVAHAIGIGSDGGHSRRGHVMAKHAAYGVFLQRLTK